jgi:hypothetical protein
MASWERISGVRDVTPNTYEAPTCQEAKEGRRKIKGLPLHVFHARSLAVGVTDLISSSGFAGTCPAPNTYRGSTRHGPVEAPAV